MTRLVLGLLWLVHFLPLCWQAVLGRVLGRALFLLVRERRHVTLTNLRLCFPDMPKAEREILARRHFEAFGRSFIERGLLWWGGAARIRRLVTVKGEANFAAAANRPVILLAPHFVALDTGWTWFTLHRPMASIYSKQKNPVFNRTLFEGRMRFNHPLLLSRQEGPRQIVKAMKTGRLFYYLPDMDYGRRDSIFVPFFGISTATITGLSRLARMTGAVVLPVVTRMVGQGYELEIGPVWESFPGDDEAADARRMNAFIEAEISRSPEQYLWMHKRFKTRPEGEKGVY
ncbi:lipid A biosynthesis acyltransferase [bacterium]|nr:lipid A biosynthesis acyltransferase [bacterium]